MYLIPHLLLFFGTSAALGTNCQGNTACKTARQDGLALLRWYVGRYIYDGDGGKAFVSGRHIACINATAGANPLDIKPGGGGLCAYYANGASGTPSDAAKRLQQLTDFGCKACGSVPTRGSDVLAGMLTAQVVSRACCRGNVCFC
ncbi:kp4 domain-containing protein [Purpureocillium lilacinum]|uniref:Kp4 domain-containing protein n=1 Tax=Purpureocillium lilacinum TaxID=33203 RepID=A0A179FEF3_PURLI|nr:kp4 domain-containing protein [Purpureocillium lilacinum]